MVKTIFIDVDNTLLDFNECAKWSMEKALADHGIFYPDIFGVFKKINDLLWLEIEKGGLTREGLYKKRWNMVFESAGIKLNGVEFEREFLHYLEESAKPVQGAYEALEYLSGKYTVCVASNAPQSQQEKRLKKAGMLKFLHKVFTSEQIGYPKPSKAFFDGCFEKLGGIEKDEVILIGDSLTADVVGGAEYGLKTCWFNYAGEALPETVSPDFVVNTLWDIKKIL